MNFSTHQRSRAFTLIELLLSMTIGMLIMGAVYMAYKTARNGQTVKEVYDITSVLLKDSQDVTATKTEFTVDNVGGGEHDVGVADLVNAKGGIEEFPRGTSLVDGTTFGHPFGGEITMSAESTNGGVDKDLVVLEFTRIPKGQCPHMLSKLLSLSVYDIYVNNNLIALSPAADANSIGRDEVRMDQAADLCNEEEWPVIKIRQLKDIRYVQMRAGPFGSVMTTQERAFVLPLYTRQENALAAREAAQLALP